MAKNNPRLILLGTDPPESFTEAQYKKLLLLKTNVVHVYNDWGNCPHVLEGLKEDLPLAFNARPN